MRRLSLAICLVSVSAYAQPVAEKRAALDKLLDALHTAPSEHIAAGLEEKIRELWVRAGTPSVTLLMSRGLRELSAGTLDEAEAVFDDALTLDPTLAEAWHQRGIARFRAGNLAGALRDIQETIKQEPRHFGAWLTLVRIAEAREDWKAAHDAWRHLLDIDPRTPKGEERLKDLKRKAFGDNA